MKTVRESYVKRLRDNYLLILRTLMHDIIVSIDSDGNFVFVNDAAVEFFGKPRKQLIGTHFSGYIHPDDLKKAIAALQELMEKKGQVKGFILRGKSPSGYKTIAWNGLAIFDDIGNYVGAQATGKDLSDLLRAEEELKQSRQHFQSLFEVIVDPIVILDLTGTILELSQSAEEILGFSKDELVGKSFLETKVVKVDTEEVMTRNLKRMKQGNYIPPYAVDFLTKDGKTLSYEVNPARIIYNGEDAILAIFRNITEQKKAEAKLRASEERFRYFIENAPEAIWIQDLTGTFVDGNKRAEEITGYKRDELIGTSILDTNLVPPKYVPQIMEALETNLKGQRSGPTELELIRKDGSTVFIEASSIPVQREGQIEIIGIARDISDRKKSEEALKKSEERFRSTLDGMLEGCQIIGYDWRYIYVNDAAATHARVPKKDLLGKTMMEIYPGIEKTELFSVLQKSMKEHLHTHLEHEFVYPDGKKAWFDLSIEPVAEGIFVLTIDITDRKEVQEALRREREMLEMVTGNINAGLVVVSKDFTVLWANEVLKKYLGDIEGKPCYSTLNQEQNICQGCGVKEVFDNGKDWVLHEQAVQTPQGDTIWLEITATAIRDKNGEIVAASEMSWDITERKKTELKMKESLEKFRTIFEGATDGIAAINPETQKFAFANPRMSEITGFSPKELLNINIFDLLSEDFQRLGKEQYAKLLDGKISLVQGVPILRKDKSIAYCDVNSKLMKIGAQLYYVAFLRDVTEQKIAEDKLRESEQRFKHFLFNAPEAIWVQDVGGTFIDGNKMAEELTGYSREELIGKNMLEMGLVEPEYIPKVLDSFQPVEIGERSGPTELVMKRKDGSSVIVEASIIPVEREGKIEIIGVVLDVTERKKAQEAIAKTNHLLKQSNQELESYTYVVSHDLKAPLRTIRSFGSFILEDYADKLDETGKDYLNRMVNASSHLDSMIEDLLVLSRVGRKFTEFEKVNLNKLLEEIISDIETTIKETNTKIVVDKLPVITLQRVWIKQVFMNLLSNALKFNESKAPKIEIKYEPREKDHLFTVRDNGIGIEKKYLERIFNLFERAPTEKKYEGTGAGLAICKKIVEQLGGKIWVESTPKKGSSFFFTIPKETKQATEV